MLRLVLAGLLLVFAGFSAPAQSATYRYSFDVVHSDISFIDLRKLVLGDPTGDIAWQPGEYEYYMRKYHPFGGVYEMGGKVVMDLHVSGSDELRLSGETKQRGSVSCVSGFLCLLEPVSFLIESFGDFRTAIEFSTSVGNIESFSTSENFTLDYLHYGDLTSGTPACDFEPNCVVDYWAASAYFTIANFSRTEIAPVPLPATAWLLGLGILAVCFKTRRRRRPS